MAKLLEEHRVELEQKEDQTLEARRIAQEAVRKFDSAKGNYSKMKKSLELTGASVKQMEAEQESWREFLKQMDSQLSSKFFHRPLFFVPSAYPYIFFLRFRRWFPAPMQELPQRL